MSEFEWTGKSDVLIRLRSLLSNFIVPQVYELTYIEFREGGLDSIVERLRSEGLGTKVVCRSTSGFEDGLKESGAVVFF